MEAREHGHSTTCRIILGIGMMGVLFKIGRIQSQPDRTVYLGTLALIDAATLYAMLHYCRQGKTLEGFVITVVTEAFLRAVAAKLLLDEEAPPPSDDSRKM